MKYPEHKLSMETALPSSVQSWLGNELEIRGIDSVIYSRYVIHLLLEDHDEDCTEYLELLFNPRLDIKSRLKSHKKSHTQEEKKKKAAIECLQAVSEENSGIETLVEELCNRLKDLNQSSGSDDTDQGDSTPSPSDGSSSEFEDPAERYYAAFPALSQQNEKSPVAENFQQSFEIWKDNPLKKPPFEESHSVREIKQKKTGKRKDEKKRSKRKHSPNNQGKKKHTPQRPIPKPKPKSVDTCHTRFMSWPQSDFIPEKQTTEEKKLCQQVENILKEMLLHEKPGNERKFKEKIRYDSDECVSPELQENSFWYTKQFVEMFTPVESGLRLYERHSCPFFHNDDVFLDPDTASDKEEFPLEDDQFGLHDLLKNHELQSVAESVLQNVDQDFSENEVDLKVSEEKTNAGKLHHASEEYQEMDVTPLKIFNCSTNNASLSPYDNTTLDFSSLSANNPAVDQQTSSEERGSDTIYSLWWIDSNQDQVQNGSLIPADIENNTRNTTVGTQDVSLPSWMCNSKSELDDIIDRNNYPVNENFSQLWDINIWNKTHNCLQKGKQSFDVFDTTFEDFKSGLTQLPEKTSNRNSGVFNISMINEGLDTVDNIERENINTLIPKITFDAVDVDLSAGTQELQEYPNTSYDRSISLTDVHLLKSLGDNQDTSKEKLSKSFEIIPSNNSAFNDVIPKKISHFHSDSNIYFNYSTLINFEENSEKQTDEEDKKENLYLSPKTHFRPISAIVEDDMTDLHLRDLFGGYTSSRTQYQKYQDVTDSGDEDSFVPMFKVCVQHDKYIQTGTSIDEQPANIEKTSNEDQGRPPETIQEELDNMDITQDFDVYGYVDSLTASAQNTPQNVQDVACNTCCDSGYEEANDEDKIMEDKSSRVILNDNCQLTHSGPMEWAGQRSEDDWMIKDSENVGKISCSIPDSIWSCNEDNNFPDMFSFFAEDCDDLKTKTVEGHRDIETLSTFYLRESEIGQNNAEEHLTSEMSVQEVPSDVTKVKLVIGKGKKVLQDIENYPREKTVSQPIYVKGYMPMPSVAVYSCELEKEWLDNESPQSFGKSSKMFKGPGKKPCTFFMEGSCKRSDCKFSHDLSSITCRFWEEGDCFKGDLCPFLHGYYMSDISVDMKENLHGNFEFQEEEFPHLSNSVKKQKQRITKIEGTNTNNDSRKNYRASKPKSTEKKFADT